MSESNNNIPMRITQLEEATAYEDGMFYAVAKAGGGTKKIKTSIIQDPVKNALEIDKTFLTQNIIDDSEIIGKTPSEINFKDIYFFEGIKLFDLGFNNVTLIVKDEDGNAISVGCVYAPIYEDGTVGSFNYSVNASYNKANFTNYEDIVGIRFRAYSSAPATPIYNLGIQYNSNPYQEYEEYSNSWLNNKINYLGLNSTENVTIETSENIINIDGTSATFRTYEHAEVEVKQGEIYIISGVGFNVSFPLAIFYDVSHNVISSYGTKGQYITAKVLIPENAVSMLINNDTRYGSLSVKKGTMIAECKEIEPDYNSYWSGKKIVWFGTSIPAGVINAGDSGGYGSYPIRLGKMLNASVYNESIGSSCVKAGTHGEAVTEDNPMGFVDATATFLSMSLSSSEKQSIYNDWDSKWKNIISGGSSIDWDNMSKYYNSSWDIMLNKYLTGGSVGQVDAYVFDHGFNDRGESILDVPENEDDRRYFYGAMSFLFKKILADNPKATIIICGHYSNTQTFRGGEDLVKWVCEAQTELHKKWSFPLIKTWEYMGFSFVSFTYNGDTTTVLKEWMPDGIHPASDSTGKALEHYAEVLYPLFNSIR